VMEPKFAPLVGFVAGALYVQMSNLMIFVQIDDPVDTAAVHLTGGIIGLLAVALFADGGQLLSIYGTGAVYTSQ
jgi:ammonia channel protein AmtB